MNSSFSTKDYLNRWLLQKNYPEVAVILEGAGNRTRISFRQKRYVVTDLYDEGYQSPFKYSLIFYCIY